MGQCPLPAISVLADVFISTLSWETYVSRQGPVCALLVLAATQHVFAQTCLMVFDVDADLRIDILA